MYVLKTMDGFYYTGRTGEYWLSRDREEAFTYSKAEAERKAGVFNKNHLLHGKLFMPLVDQPA